MVSNETSSAEERKKLEEEKGIIIRFVIGHRSGSVSPDIHCPFSACLPYYYYYYYVAVK